MKNLLILFLMIAFGFAAHAQLVAFKDIKPAKNFKLNRMEVNFLKFKELSQFKNRIAEGKSGLEKFEINEDFIFVYTIAETMKVAGTNVDFGGMKVEITDQPNSVALIKEINDSIDGIIEIIAAQ